MLKGPRRRRKEVVAPTLEQIHLLRDLLAAHDRRDSARGVVIRDLGDVGDILIATGARIGKVLALRWSDIDLENRTLTIRATIVRSPGQGAVIQERPKTDSSTRRLKLPSFALDVLTRRRLDAYCELVFPASAAPFAGPRTSEPSGHTPWHRTRVDDAGVLSQGGGDLPRGSRGHRGGQRTARALELAHHLAVLRPPEDRPERLLVTTRRPRWRRPSLLRPAGPDAPRPQVPTRHYGC